MSWEVWTMKLKMSFFDPTLLKKNTGRFAPAWGLLTVFLFLNFPLSLMLRLNRWDDYYPISNAVEAHLDDMVGFGVVYAFGAAILFAALVFKYLHKTGSAYMMHAFPMTRGCQFLTNAVSGLLFWLVPVLLTVLCEQGILAASGLTAYGGRVWAAAGKWCLAYLCFYGLAVFAMQLSGRTVIAILSYGALSVMFLVLPLLILLMVGFYFRGFDYSVPDSIVRLSPVAAMLSDSKMSFGTYAIYGAVGLVLLALGWLLCRARHVERAGDPMVFPWARIAFRILFTLCVALGLGWILYGAFGLFNESRGNSYLPYALLGCFMGWFGSSMMIERTVKVFRNRKVWLGFAAFAAVLTLTVVGLKYDLLHIQSRVPRTEEVVSVEVWTVGDQSDSSSDCITLTEPADIDTVRDFQLRALRTEQPNGSTRDIFGYSGYGKVHICYHLANGGTLRRAYEPSLIDCAGLKELFSRPDIAAAWYEKALPERFVRVMLEGVEDYFVDEDGTPNYIWNEHECADAAALRDAVLADARAGRLPIVNFITRESKPNMEEVRQFGSGQYILDNLYLMFEYRGSGPYTDYLSINITDTAEETIKLFLR